MKVYLYIFLLYLCLYLCVYVFASSLALRDLRIISNNAICLYTRLLMLDVKPEQQFTVLKQRTSSMELVKYAIIFQSFPTSLLSSASSWTKCITAENLFLNSMSTVRLWTDDSTCWVVVLWVFFSPKNCDKNTVCK